MAPSAAALLRISGAVHSLTKYALRPLTAGYSSGPVQEDAFKPLHIDRRTRRSAFKGRRRTQVAPPRFQSMLPEQDWTNVWPGPCSFKQSTVPFPVRMGETNNQVENEGLPPHKYGNAELIKIPNFLHLTPVHIQKQCAALKKYCTPWPSQLSTDAECTQHFPVEVTLRDYVHAGPNIRDERSRLVHLRFPVSSLRLDEHAREKLVRLVGQRFSAETGSVTLVTDVCPLKKENYEYAVYLMTVLVLEAHKVEPWEADKSEADWERFIWEKSRSRHALVELVRNSPAGESTQAEKLVQSPLVQDYKRAVTSLQDKPETKHSLGEYKRSVIHLLRHLAGSASPPSDRQ